MSHGKATQLDDQYDRGGAEGAGAAPDVASAVGASAASLSFDAPSTVAEAAVASVPDAAVESHERWGGNVAEQVGKVFADLQHAYQNPVSTENADAVRYTLHIRESASNAPSTILGKALERAGDLWPGPGFEPHHIVPEGDPRAQEAQDLLEKYHIDINAAINGVWLGRGPDTPNADAMTRHEFTFDDNYFEAMNAILFKNKDPQEEDVKAALREIRNLLQNAGLP